jgi:uncharacterized protein YndB with AHSA1/START domain
MIEITREASVRSAPGTVWELISSPARAAEWLTFADRVEVLSGEGAGQRRRQHGHWGRKRSEIDQEITTWDPPKLIAWRHLAERLDGKPAPRFAASTEFQIQLAPAGQHTSVRLCSRQEPAGVLQALVMRLFGNRNLARQMERSLDRLAAAIQAGGTPNDARTVST